MARIYQGSLQRAFEQSVVSVQYRLMIDLGDLLRADPESRSASWQRARKAGVLSPNEIRVEEGFPTVVGGDDIKPPIAERVTDDLDAAEFAPIKGELCRLFLDHRDELGVVGLTDEFIVANTDDVMTVLMALVVEANRAKATEWLNKFSWFADACAKLLDDAPTENLDS